MSVDTGMNISPVLGTNEPDDLRGTGRSEVLSGAGGDDRIQALSGDDEVFGGTGDDTLFGQGGNDTLYGNGKPAYVDLTNLVMTESVTAKVTFVDEGAGFRNALGAYEIGPDGSISNVRILFPNSSKQGSGGDLIPGVSSTEFEIPADDCDYRLNTPQLCRSDCADQIVPIENSPVVSTEAPRVGWHADPLWATTIGYRLMLLLQSRRRRGGQTEGDRDDP